MNDILFADGGGVKAIGDAVAPGNRTPLGGVVRVQERCRKLVSTAKLDSG